MVKPNAKMKIADWMDVPPTAIPDKVDWSSVSVKGTVAAQRTDSIILIIRIHEGDSEVGRC